MKKLDTLRRRWKFASLLYCGLLAVAVALFLTAGLRLVLGWSLWTGVAVLAVAFGVFLLAIPFWRLHLTDIAIYLDRSIPELEDSCGLLLRPLAELNALERLQVARVEDRLGRVPLPRPFYGRLLRAGGWLGLALLGSIVLGAMRRGPRTGPVRGVVVAPVTREPAVAGVASALVRIVPPAYTGKGVHSQEALNLQVQEGATVSWELRTKIPVDTVSFLFNDSVRLPLRPDAGRTVWRLSRPAVQAGFYQVKLGGVLSELYKFELIKDEPPKITIRTPKSYTLIDYGESVKIPLTVQLRDDYGIAAASIVATVSSGKGEAVKFNQQELHWDRSFAGNGTSYDLARVLDLDALGLKPGDELYFYCKARDNHDQESRTETYIISLADTAQLMSLQGMTMATDVKPEFFRSERQIIIEAEQLLSQQDTIAVTQFNSRSNDLGVDQKLLRLRYGKFLGEEAEEGEGISDTASMGTFGDATKILDAFTDKHDNAEDATFFEPAVKQQLKATLSEMWSAELRLRTFKPKEALPYCYKALRLLKDLQQQSRAYVAKTGVKLTPLNPAKRLTGELGGIAAPQQRVVLPPGLSDADELRMGLAVLESLRAGGTSGYVVATLGMGDRAILSQVERTLAGAAARRPGQFLTGYSELKKLADGKHGDIVLIEKAIGGLLPEEAARPVVRDGVGDGGLSKLYFSYLP
jgi:hypothetical protein